MSDMKSTVEYFKFSNGRSPLPPLQLSALLKFFFLLFLFFEERMCSAAVWVHHRHVSFSNLGAVSLNPFAASLIGHWLNCSLFSHEKF